MTTLRHAWTLSLVAAAVAASGCVEHNRRMTMGDDLVLGTFDADATPPTTSTGNTLNREHWGTTRFIVPVDGVAARHTWRTHPEADPDATPRQRGEYPTAISAVDTDEPYRRAQLPQAGRAIGLGLTDAVLMPGRALIYRTPEEAYSPIEPYDRAPWQESPELPLTGRPVSASASLPTPASFRADAPPQPMRPAPAPTSSTPTSINTDRLPPAPNPSPRQHIPPRPNP